MRTISFQLYSARNSGPLSEVLQRLGGFGYTAVEGYDDLYGEPRALADLLVENGLSMPSSHFGLRQLEDTDAALRTAKALGVTSIVCPNIEPQMRNQSTDEWKSLAQRLTLIGRDIRAAGLRFAWHNNDFEFKPTAQGDLPMRILLDEAPDLDWQFDVVWAIHGGSDPGEWFDRYGPRIFSLHVKDVAPKGANAEEGGWADVGHGTVDWQALIALAEAKTASSLFVLEHEDARDPDRFARRSIVAANNWK